MSNSKKIAQTSIKKNYIYNTIYQVLSLITPLITAPYISRVLGSSGVGIYSYTNSIVTYFTLFAALGTASYGQREIAMHRNDSKASSKLFWEIEFLSITTTAVSLIIWLIWICVSTQYTAVYGVLTLSVLAVAFDIYCYSKYSGKDYRNCITFSICKKGDRYPFICMYYGGNRINR